MSTWVLKAPGWSYHRFGTCNTLIQSGQQKHTTNNSRRKIMFINSTHFHNCKNKPCPAWISFKAQSLSWKVREHQIHLVLFHPAVSHMKGIGFATSQHTEKHVPPSKCMVPQLPPISAHLHQEVEKKLWDQTEKGRGVWESLCLCRDTGHTHWAGSSISTNTINGFSPPQVPSSLSPWYLVDLFWVYSKDSSKSLLLILLSAPWAMLKRPWSAPDLMRVIYNSMPIEIHIYIFRFILMLKSLQEK